MNRFSLKKSGLGLLCAALLFALCACQSKTLAAASTSYSPMTSETAAPATETDTPTPPPTSTATITPVPLTATPTQPPRSPTPRVRAPGSWSILSNPNEVQALLVTQDQLWSATLGGVVQWNLKTGQGRLFTTYDGLAEIQANDLTYCAVPSNQVVVAHENGQISAYGLNSQKWQRLDVPSKQGQTLGNLHALYCDNETGRLFAAGSQGLGTLDLRTGTWSVLPANDQFHADAVRAVRATGETIWLAAGDQGAYLFQGGHLTAFNNLNGFPTGSINDVALAPDGSAWFAALNGLIHFNPKDHTWANYTGQGANGLPFSSIDRVEVGKDNLVWIANSQEGICPFDPVKQACATIYPGTKQHSYTYLTVDTNGNGYVGTNGGGISILMPDGVRPLVFESPLLSNHIVDISGDAQHNIWVSTSKGIEVMEESNPKPSWKAIAPSRKGPLSANIDKLKAIGQSVWFFYADMQPVSAWDGVNWAQYSETQGIRGKIRDAVGFGGGIWFVTDQGLFWWDGAIARIVGTDTGLPGSDLNVVYPDENNTWVGTNQGLWNCQKMKCQSVVPDIAIRSITSDHQGGLLLGTDHGLFRYQDGQAYVWAINLGKQTLLDAHITALAVDADQQVWVGTLENGLFLFDGSRWQQFNTQNSFPADHIQTIYIDREKVVWISAITHGAGGALVTYKP